MKTITLLTDFGLEDWFVGVMKGVILNINSDATIVDITHDVAPQNVEQGAFVFANIPVGAFNFEAQAGLSIDLDTTLTYGAQWRVEDADDKLLRRPDPAWESP